MASVENNNNQIYKIATRRLEEFLTHINSKSSLLTNWLFALSAGSFSLFIYNLKYFSKTDLNLKWSSRFILASLILCILATFLEYIRFSIGRRNTVESFNKHKNDLDSAAFIDSLKEPFWWIWIVSIVEGMGYVILVCVAFYISDQRERMNRKLRFQPFFICIEYFLRYITVTEEIITALPPMQVNIIRS